jgi:DNA adenine methylase
MADPFLKWAGGKRWLASSVEREYTRSGGRYVEPFVGGGAVFFRIEPDSAVLSDANAELVRAYRTIKANPEPVIDRLKDLEMSREVYEDLRRAVPRTDLEATVRFIFLNRGGFNGLYRVNRRGEFNVPFGCKSGTVSVDGPALREAYRVLQAARIEHGDFRAVLATCGANDFVYLDPPYTVRHNNNGFNRYNQSLFSWADQRELATCASNLVEAGATVVVSNADHPSVRALYPADAFIIRRVRRTSRMAASALHRGPTTELLIRSRAADG